MSQSELQRLLGKALIDEMFRRRLLSDPERAIREYGFDLSPAEIKAIKPQDRAEAEALAAEMDRRLYQCGWNGPRKPVGCLEP